MNKLILPLLASLLLLPSMAQAQLDRFATGPVFQDFGPKAMIDLDMPMAADSRFLIAFDVAKKADHDKLNRSFESAARFINMHVAAGVPRENIRLAVVVHGPASFDLARPARYAEKYPDQKSGNAAAIAEMQAAGVEFFLCGQSAAAHGIAKEDLLPGVKMSLSAMTIHAQLQQRGYTLNPF